MKSEKIVAWMTFMVCAALLFGGLWVVQQMQPEDVVVGVQTTGGDMQVMPIALTGVASGGGELYGFITTSSSLQGELYKVVIDYTSGISTETDITVTHLGLTNETLLIRSDSATDGAWYVRTIAVSNTLTSFGTIPVPFYLSGRVAVNVAQTSSATPGTVYLFYRR